MTHSARLSAFCASARLADETETQFAKSSMTTAIGSKSCSLAACIFLYQLVYKLARLFDGAFERSVPEP